MLPIKEILAKLHLIEPLTNYVLATMPGVVTLYWTGYTKSAGF